MKSVEIKFEFSADVLLQYIQDALEFEPEYIVSKIDIPTVINSLKNGETITLSCQSSDVELSYDKIAFAITELADNYTSIFASLITENDYALSCDSLLQVALFGQLLYDFYYHI